MILFTYGKADGIDNGVICIFTSMINSDPSFAVGSVSESDKDDLMYGHYEETLPDLTADDVRTFAQTVERKIISGEWYGIKCDNDDLGIPERADVELAVKGNTQWLVNQLQAVVDARLAVPA